MSPEMRDAYDFSRQLRGLVPSPHKIWLANPKLSKTIVPTGVYFQTQSTLTKAEIEIVTNLINAHWLAAYGTYEHEKIGEEQGHPPPSARGARSGSRGGGRKVLDPCRNSLKKRDSKRKMEGNERNFRVSQGVSWRKDTSAIGFEN